MNGVGTVIGKGICIRGEVSGAEDFFLDGRIDGSIILADNRLTIGPNGVAQADIITGDLVVFGRLEGSAKANARAELKHAAVFTGNLIASSLSIEDSACVQGQVELVRISAPARKAPQPEFAHAQEEMASGEPEFERAV